MRLLTWGGFIASFMLVILIALNVGQIPQWVPYVLIAVAFAALLFDNRKTTDA